jgi:predicted nuclease of restriction endonuclease-like RecB superfamily
MATEKMTLEDYKARHASGKGRRRYANRNPDEPSADEKRYIDVLNLKLQAGEIVSWAYEPHTIHLARNTTYTPDFGVASKDSYTFIEIKGFLEDDASVKYKIARELCPWASWKMLRYTKNGWKEVQI